MIKKLPLLCFLFFISILDISPLPENGNAGEKIFRDTEILKQFYPCSENSENEKKVYSFIRKRLDELGIDYSEESLDLLQDTHSFTSNITVDLKGKKEKTLILAVPVNNLMDSSFNIAKALSVAEEAALEEAETNYKIIFLGAEFSREEDAHYPIGSRQFLDSFFPENDTALLYLNLSSAGAEVNIIHGSIEGVTPFWLLDQIIKSFDENSISYKINTQENILHQLGYKKKTPVDLYIKNNIPAVALENTNSASSTSDMEKWFFIFNSFYKNFSENIQIKADTDWDRHYFLIDLFEKRILLNEIDFILIYIVIISVMLLFSIYSSKKVFRYVRKLIKHFWVILYLFFLVFIFLLISTFITEIIIVLKSSHDIWKESPILILLIKIFISMLLFFLSLFLLKKINLPVTGSFYSAGAIFIFLLILMIFEIMNISLSFFALWGLLWTILFSLFKSRLLKTLSMVNSSVFILFLVYYIFTLPAENLCEEILFNRLTGNIMTAVILLPYVLMLLRILISQTHIDSDRYRILRRSIYSITAIFLIFLLNYYIKFDPFSEKNKQPVYFSQTADLDKKISLINVKSPFKPGRILFRAEDDEYQINAQQSEFSMEINSSPGHLEIEKTESMFLDRKNLILKLTGEGNPETCSISFRTKENPVVLDCNYPWTVNIKQKRGTIHIGKNPPSPLIIDLLLPSDTVLWIDIRMKYKDLPFEHELTGENLDFTKMFEIKKSTDG